MTGTETTSHAIRVAIIDDHTLFREGMGLMLNLEPDMALVGGASTIQEGLTVIARTPSRSGAPGSPPRPDARG